MKKLLHFILLGVFALSIFGCKKKDEEKATKKLVALIDDYESKMIPLQKDYHLAAFKSSTKGMEDDYENASLLKIGIARVLSNPESFALLKELKQSGIISDTLLKRQLDILFSLYMPYQVDEETQVKLITLENKIAQTFSEHRAQLNSREYSDLELEQILTTSRDNDELRAAWEASKQIGAKVAQNIILAVKKRNEIALKMGYNNYFEMQMILKGLNPAQINELYEELDILTREPYSQLKAELDTILAAYYKVPIENLMPWNYQNRFFQQAPQIYDLKLDKFYENTDLIEKANLFYNGIGLSVDNILMASDLFPAAKKSQLGFTSDIDREGDIRILLNLDKSHYSMSSLLYECGFAAYYKNIDRSLPYILREAPQFFIIDAIATFMSNFAANPVWIRDILQVPEEELEHVKKVSGKYLRLEKFVFSRWAQVMYRFEKEMYANPDQDLNALWWQLVEKYQLINRPVMRHSSDWATKTHIATQPCTYYQYMLGELVAAQIQVYINSEVLKSEDGCMLDCVNNPIIGDYFKKMFYNKGALYNYNELLKNATGEELSADYFSKLYIRMK
jgi:peptidyl-dipeptidase A